MIILLVHYNPQHYGGAESNLHDQAKALTLAGHTVIIEHKDPVAAYEKHQPDIVHFHTIHLGIGVGILTWAQNLGIPHCISMHDYWPFSRNRLLIIDFDQSCPGVTGVCDRDCIRFNNCPYGPAHTAIRDAVNNTPTIAFNTYSAEIYTRNGIRVDAVIPHGIDTDYFCPEGEKDWGKVVTSAAWANQPHKGVHILKAALRRAKVDATLIVGTTRDNVRKVLQRSGIWVGSSVYEETFWLSLTEAMAVGCAVIATDVAGGKFQVRHGATGLIVPKLDIQAMADAITHLVSDRERAMILGKNARKWAAENYSFARWGQNLLQFYEKLLQG